MAVPDYFYLLDGHALIYRACFARGPDLHAPDGEPTKGTFFFFRTLLKLIQRCQPNYLAMAVEGGRRRTLERRRLFEGYKRNRPSGSSDAMRQQLARCLEITALLGVPIYRMPGHEADDVIATLASMCSNTECRVVMVSTDKDLHQLVTPWCVCYDPYKEETIGSAEIDARWDVGPQKVVEVQTLAGDPNDGVPGVPGIGVKGAAMLINTYGSVEGVMKHLHELKPRQRAALEATDLDLQRKLVTLRRDLPLDVYIEDLEFNGLDFDAARPVFEELGFKNWKAVSGGPRRPVLERHRGD
jgi:DNA polymerase-1